MDPVTFPESTPPLGRVLADILFTPDHRALLRACLLEGQAGEAAWRTWRAAHRDPRDAFEGPVEGLKGLLPLFFTAVRRGGLTSDRRFLTYLRTAYLRETVRYRSYTRVCREVLSALTGAGIDGVVLEGSAIADAVYPDPATRHSHGLRVWVTDGAALDAGRRVLERAGLVVDPHERSPGDPVTLHHRSCMPVFLQAEVFPGLQYDVPVLEIRTRAVPASIAGVAVRTLCQADALVHTCGCAPVRPDRETLRWLCDAWFLTMKATPGDFGTVVSRATDGGLAVTLLVTLSYLRGALSAPVPDDTLAALGEAADRDPAGCERLLRDMQQAERLSLVALALRPPRWPSRLVMTAYLAFPSAPFMRARLGLPEHSALLPHYLRRLRSHFLGPLRAWTRRGLGATAPRTRRNEPA